MMCMYIYVCVYIYIYTLNKECFNFASYLISMLQMSKVIFLHSLS